MADRTSTLIPRETDVLRHVHALKTSARIAYSPQIAEVSINETVDRARRKLGGISRCQARLLLAEEEGRMISYPAEPHEADLHGLFQV